MLVWSVSTYSSSFWDIPKPRSPWHLSDITPRVSVNIMDVRATTSRPQHKVQSRRVHNAREKSFPQGVRVSKGTKRLGAVDGQIYKTTYSTYNDCTMAKVILFLVQNYANQTTVKPIYIHQSSIYLFPPAHLLLLLRAGLPSRESISGTPLQATSAVCVSFLKHVSECE